MEATEAPRVLDASQLRLVAVVASCDPRSVAAVLRGEQVRGSVSDRVRWALADLRKRGLLPAHPVSEQGQ